MLAGEKSPMGKRFEEITESMATWLSAQPIFFVATAPLDAQGLINCSPKGNREEFTVLDARRVAYLDQTGSGVETIAHLRENARVVLMFCAFEGPARIVRLHGKGHAVLRDTADFAEAATSFPGAGAVGVRSIIQVDVERISDSCGYGVPFMDFTKHRPTLDQWSARKGSEGIRDYWSEKNQVSVDGLDGIDVA